MVSIDPPHSPCSPLSVTCFLSFIFVGPHAKIVYHKDGISTHAFRFANQQDDAVENDKHQWIRGSLIDWSSWPSTDLRSKMIQGFNGGGIKCKLADDLFGTYLAKAVGNLVRLDCN